MVGGDRHETHAEYEPNEQDDTKKGRSYAADMEGDKQQEMHQDASNQNGHMRTLIQSTDNTIAIDSLRLGQRVTCTVIDRQMSRL